MALTEEQIAKLTRKADQQETARSHKSRWLTVEDAAELLKAVESGKKGITIGGMKMTIKYETRDKVWVSPANQLQFVPCGWYTTQLLKSIAATH
jgi:hypothetical protein